MTDLLIKRIAELHIINRTDTNQSVSITNINLIETLLITLVFDKKKEIEKFVEHLRQKGGLNYNLDLRNMVIHQ